MNLHPEREDARRMLTRYGYKEAEIERLFEFHSTANDLRPFVFPWSEAEEFLKSQGRTVINLVGYGSLMNPVSAARTIRDTPVEGHPPVVALGARRVFNYQIPNSVFLRYGQEPGVRDKAALNAEPTEFGVLNGRLLQVHVDDFPGLRIREKAYDLQPVTCVDWNKRTEAPFVAYALCCGVEVFEGERYVDNDLIPFRPYAELCREGAKLVSPEFLEMYLETAFLADRVTTAKQWETQLPPR